MKKMIVSTKHDVAHNDRHGSERHMAMNTNRGNGGHFGRR